MLRYAAGILMATLQLQQQANAAVLNCRNLNEYVRTSLAAWKAQNGLASAISRQFGPSPRAMTQPAAGTSSFGMSGTNAHLIAGPWQSGDRHWDAQNATWQRSR